MPSIPAQGEPPPSEFGSLTSATEAQIVGMAEHASGNVPVASSIGRNDFLRSNDSMGVVSLASTNGGNLTFDASYVGAGSA